tara:strand:+ start:287 stop:625 length:339 start_codon:yes stop_codon:yes gene_type:complete
MSCSNQEAPKFSGDWKLESLNADEESIPFPEPGPITSFRSDNLVFYYNTLMRYEIKEDSLILYDEQAGTISRRFKYEFNNENVFTLNFIRRVRVDSLEFLDIKYKSKWIKVD